MIDSLSADCAAAMEEFLDLAMRRLRSSSPVREDGSLTATMVHDSAGSRFAQIWFQARGCAWSRAGACTMCNYGDGREVEPAAVIEAIGAAMSRLPESVDEILVSPSGNLLDPCEVTPALLDGICDVLCSSPIRRVCFETRPETITDDRMRNVTRLLPGKQITVEMGLESASTWVRTVCLNRHGTLADFRDAIATVRAHGHLTCANVSLGVPFLGPKEATADAVHAVEWAHAQGTDLVVVFPLHVKAATMLAWMHERGTYKPVSLWSLVDVLDRIDRRALHRTSIAWYRPHATGQNILASPQTCKICYEDVLTSLDGFRANPGERALAELNGMTCACRDAWRRMGETISPESPRALARQTFSHLARDLRIEAAWSRLEAMIGPSW